MNQPTTVDRRQPQPSPLRVPSDQRIGQGTEVEKSRAAAEVEAQVVVAQRLPRDEDNAKAQMDNACRRMSLAERAFWSYRRGGSQLKGETIELARELARCWGNMQYGVAELRRDDAYGQSEMQAWAWDLESNARTSTTFIVPHARDKDGGTEPLTQQRDIYENNANNGARRVRECIFALLPRWYRDKAIEICRHTLEKGEGRPMEDRIADTVKHYKSIGISVAQLEKHVERTKNRWTGYDVADLGVLYRSIERGEIRKDEAFPEAGVTGQDIAAAAAARVTAGQQQGVDAQQPQREPTGENTSPASPPADPPAAAGRPTAQGKPSNTGQHKALAIALGKLGITEDAERITVTGKLAGRRDITSTKELTDAQAAELITYLHRLLESDTETDAADQLRAALAQTDDEHASAQQDGQQTLGGQQ